MEQKKQIVILGAGFGGLRAAMLLGKYIRRSGMENSCQVVVVDRNAYHTYTPTLYEVATTSKETADYVNLKSIVTFPIEKIVKKLGGRFIQAEIESLDLKDGDVHLKNSGVIKFDYLVLALGAETNYFDIPGLKENSAPLKWFTDALKIRDRVLELAQSGKEEIRIVIGGGGSTGVEFAGELQGWLAEMEVEIEEQKHRQCKFKITIIEAGPSILLGFPAAIINRVQKRLKSLGAEIIANHPIEKVAQEKILLNGKRELPYDLLVWAGGVKAASLMGTMPLKLEKRGRVEVAGEMECLPQSPDLKLYGKIYAIGDAVCFYDQGGRPIPGVARAAMSQAKIVAHNIICDIQGRKDHWQYRPMEYPYIIPIGGKWAIAKLGPIVIWGFGGWALKILVEINYLRMILPFWKAIKAWLRGLWIFIQNDRLG